MCLKIRCDGEYEKFCKFFWELNKALIGLLSSSASSKEALSNILVFFLKKGAKALPNVLVFLVKKRKRSQSRFSFGGALLNIP